jgi:hypothetical protein
MPRLMAASSSSVGITIVRLIDLVIHLTFVCLAKAHSSDEFAPLS